jgi:hypothetical protein
LEAADCTPTSDASGLPSERHSATRLSVCPERATFQKKLFADRNIRSPPRSR